MCIRDRQEAVSIHGNNVLIRGLKVGETYQIRETKAREGYNWQILEKEGYKLSLIHI